MFFCRSLWPLLDAHRCSRTRSLVIKKQMEQTGSGRSWVMWFRGLGFGTSAVRPLSSHLTENVLQRLMWTIVTSSSSEKCSELEFRRDYRVKAGGKQTSMDGSLTRRCEITLAGASSVDGSTDGLLVGCGSEKATEPRQWNMQGEQHSIRDTDMSIGTLLDDNDDARALSNLETEVLALRGESVRLLGWGND